MKKRDLVAELAALMPLREAGRDFGWSAEFLFDGGENYEPLICAMDCDGWDAAAADADTQMREAIMNAKFSVESPVWLQDEDGEFYVDCYENKHGVLNFAQFSEILGESPIYQD